MIWGIIKAIEVGLFGYLVWRNLRDDYKDEQLISYAWWSVLLVLIGGRVGYGLVHWGVWNEQLIDWFLVWQKPGFNYFGGLAGLAVATIWYCRECDWKIWAFLESITKVAYLFLIFMLIEEWVRSGWGVKIASYVLVVMVGYVLSLWVSKRYRSFVWYRSGKKGFVFFFVNSVVGLLMAGLSWWWGNGLIVTSAYLIMSLISVVGLVMLGNDKN